MEGKKLDTGKTLMSLIPFAALTEIGKVLTFGAKKYAAHNWRKGMDWSRLQGALLRHYTAFSEGEDNDPETGLPHLAHLGCCVLFLLEYQLKGLGKDDRYHNEDKVYVGHRSTCSNITRPPGECGHCLPIGSLND